MKRTDVVNSLRLVATVLSGGTLKPPPNMVKEIYALVKRTYASWCYTMTSTSLEEVTTRLARLQPDETTTIPAPKLSPAITKKYKETAQQIADGTVDDFVRRVISRIGRKPVDIDNQEVKQRARALAQAKTLDGLDIETIDLLIVILHTYPGSGAATTALRAVSAYRVEVQMLTLRKNGLGSPDDLEIRRLEAQRDLFLSFLDFLQRAGGSTVKGLKKTNGVVKISTTAVKNTDVTVPVDLSGLPPNYPTTSPFSTITLRMMPLTDMNGFWSPKERLLAVTMAKISTDEVAFNMNMSMNLDTIEHELEHMVQTIIRENLLAKGQNNAAKRAGTPFNRRTFGRGVADPVEQLRKVNPEITDKEAYYLDPDEFFPQIGTYVGWFRLRYGYSKDDQPKPVQQRLEDWKKAVGMSTGSVMIFFHVLKKYDKPRYRRAVVEGWELLNKQIEADKE